jgi:alkanesulfonate monooxygenase SsuD/methylene tetrahydromethanopterin reductase-like flavin-dependent oxidoreductase (luciferase family)
MHFGIHLPHAGERATPALIRRFALQAEALGFADVWVSEHIILPRTQFPRKLPFYEPVLTLTWVAAVTERVRLGTSVLVLPMRHPIPLAKELATLQNLSEGRLILAPASAGSPPSSPPSARRSTSAADAWTKASR